MKPGAVMVRMPELRSDIVPITLLLLIAIALPAVADEGDEKREVSVEVTDDKATISLSRENTTIEDGVLIEFDTGSANILVEHEFEEERGEVETETESKLEVQFHQLIEHVDENGNGRFDAGEEVVSAWRLSDGSDEPFDPDAGGTVEWRPLQVEDMVSDDGTLGKRITGTAQFQTIIGPDLTSIVPSADAHFGLVLYVFGDFTTLAGATLEPSEVKIDIVINGFPYTREDTAVALIMETSADHEFEREGPAGAEDNRVSVDAAAAGRNVDLIFTWEPTAIVDGEDRSVHTTVLEADSETKTDPTETEFKDHRTFALSYARGDTILHDPVIGASFDGRADSRGVPGPAIGVLLVAVGVTARAAGRRSR